MLVFCVLCLLYACMCNGLQALVGASLCGMSGEVQGEANRLKMPYSLTEASEREFYQVINEFERNCSRAAKGNRDK